MTVRSAVVLLFAACLAAASLTGLGACGKTETPGFASEEAGIADVMAQPGTWGTSDCGTCALAACATERATCASDPLCARNLDCVEACPLDENSEPAAGCVQSCPATSSTESEAARAALEQCRVEGAGAACTSCFGVRRAYKDPLLTNVCPDPQWDAGPDATPTQESCSKCAAERCCDSQAACRADDSCAALQDCVADADEANDNSAREACLSMYDSAIAGYGGSFVCLDVLCPSDCGVTLSDCFSCSITQCGDEFAQCQGDHDCYLLSDCIDRCAGAAGCDESCYVQYPAGAALADALQGCGAAFCATACNSIKTPSP